MKTKITAVALIAVSAGVFAYTRPYNAVPSDLRDAVADNSAVDTLKSGVAASDINVPAPPAAAAEQVGGESQELSDFGKIIGAMLKERERAESAVVALAAYGKGQNPEEFYRAADLYRESKASVNSWVALAPLMLLKGELGRKDVAHFSEMTDESDKFVSGVAKLTGKSFPGSPIKKLAFNSSSALSIGLREIQKAYDRSDNEGRDILIEAVTALKWRNFEEISSGAPAVEAGGAEKNIQDSRFRPVIDARAFAPTDGE